MFLLQKTKQEHGWLASKLILPNRNLREFQHLKITEFTNTNNEAGSKQYFLELEHSPQCFIWIVPLSTCNLVQNQFDSQQISNLPKGFTMELGNGINIVAECTISKERYVGFFLFVCFQATRTQLFAL